MSAYRRLADGRMNTTLADPTLPVVAGRTRFRTLLGGIDVAVKARSRRVLTLRSVWTFLHPAAIHLKSETGFWSKDLRSPARAARRSRP